MSGVLVATLLRTPLFISTSLPVDHAEMWLRSLGQRAFLAGWERGL
jgi:hypothetical protein